MSGPLSVDVCIVGGGPAGSVVAHRLAQIGHSVCLVEHGGAASPALPESLGPAVAALLQAAGLDSALASAEPLPCNHTRLSWSGATMVRDGVDALIVDRGRFDRSLRSGAAAGGVAVLCPARAGRPQWQGNEWVIPVNASESPSVRSRFLVEATGRRGRPTTGPRNIALCGRWGGLGSPTAPEMTVEAAVDAWFWAAPQNDGGMSALAFVDRNRCAGLDEAERHRLYLTLLSKSPLLQRCLSGTLLDRVRARDASFAIDQEPVSRRMIKVGDCALALDPISSQGVQSAIRSALQASVVVNTILTGGDAAAAIEFYCGSLRSAANLHRTMTAEAYASQTLYVSPFWSRRSELGDARPPIVSSAIDRVGLDHTLRLSDEASIRMLPVIEADVVRRRLVIDHPSLHRPVAWVEGIPVDSLLMTMREGQSPDSLVANWSIDLSETSARRVLEWLVRHNILVTT